MTSTTSHRRAAVLALVLTATAAVAADPFADEVVEFSAGPGAGFGADQLPAVVLGPPRGAGALRGSTDVVSLGHGGTITLRFSDPVICNGDGVDFTVFENAFTAGNFNFAELAFVELSQDGRTFFAYPFDPATHAGLAGRSPVFSTPDNGIDATDPTVSGGDSFDLAEVSLAWAAFVRITDAGDEIDDPGNAIPPGVVGGFDLDAIVAVHACVVAPSTPTPPSAAATPSPTATHALDGDLNGDGRVDDGDLEQLVNEIFDGDGKDVAAATGGTILSGPLVDANDDAIVSAADITALLMLLHDR